MNLEDIAKIAGVSRSTVSRVVNDDPHVSDKTRERVLEVISEHNYSPNTAARALVTQRTQVLGLYIPYFVSHLFTDPYFPMLIQAIVGRANERDYDVMLWLRGQEGSRAHLHQRVLENRMTDGLILASTTKDDLLPQALLERNRTFIVNGRPWHNPNRINYVDTDNVRGAQQAVEHLARLGRRRIAAIHGWLDIISGYDRCIGYRQAIKRLDLPQDADLEAAGDFTEAGGFMAMTRLLKQRPDAVFVASDHMALGALRAIREAGLSVPDDIAIVGFDDMPFSVLVSPQLTTIRQPIARLGALAAEGLIDLLSGSAMPPYQVLLTTEIVIRESCGYTA
jgi:LacI family transcriptional regulator